MFEIFNFHNLGISIKTQQKQTTQQTDQQQDQQQEQQQEQQDQQQEQQQEQQETNINSIENKIKRIDENYKSLNNNNNDTLKNKIKEIIPGIEDVDKLDKVEIINILKSEYNYEKDNLLNEKRRKNLEIINQNIRDMPKSESIKYEDFSNSNLDMLAKQFKEMEELDKKRNLVDKRNKISEMYGIEKNKLNNMKEEYYEFMLNNKELIDKLFLKFPKLKYDIINIKNLYKYYKDGSISNILQNSDYINSYSIYKKEKIFFVIRNFKDLNSDQWKNLVLELEREEKLKLREIKKKNNLIEGMKKMREERLEKERKEEEERLEKERKEEKERLINEINKIPNIYNIYGNLNSKSNDDLNKICKNEIQKIKYKNKIEVIHELYNISEEDKDKETFIEEINNINILEGGNFRNIRDFINKYTKKDKNNINDIIKYICYINKYNKLDSESINIKCRENTNNISYMEKEVINNLLFKFSVLDDKDLKNDFNEIISIKNFIEDYNFKYSEDIYNILSICLINIIKLISEKNTNLYKKFKEINDKVETDLCKKEVIKNIFNSWKKYPGLKKYIKSKERELIIEIINNDIENDIENDMENYIEKIKENDLKDYMENYKQYNQKDNLNHKLFKIKEKEKEKEEEILINIIKFIENIKEYNKNYENVYINLLIEEYDKVKKDNYLISGILKQILGIEIDNSYKWYNIFKRINSVRNFCKKYGEIEKNKEKKEKDKLEKCLDSSNFYYISKEEIEEEEKIKIKSKEIYDKDIESLKNNLSESLKDYIKEKLDSISINEICRNKFNKINDIIINENIQLPNLEQYNNEISKINLDLYKLYLDKFIHIAKKDKKEIEYCDELRLYRMKNDENDYTYLDSLWIYNFSFKEFEYKNEYYEIDDIDNFINDYLKDSETEEDKIKKIKELYPQDPDNFPINTTYSLEEDKRRLSEYLKIKLKHCKENNINEKDNIKLKIKIYNKINYINIHNGIYKCANEKYEYIINDDYDNLFFEYIPENIIEQFENKLKNTKKIMTKNFEKFKKIFNLPLSRSSSPVSSPSSSPVSSPSSSPVSSPSSSPVSNSNKNLPPVISLESVGGGKLKLNIRKNKKSNKELTKKLKKNQTKKSNKKNKLNIKLNIKRSKK